MPQIESAITQKHAVPDDRVGPLADATDCAADPARLRHAFAEHGYVFLRGVLDRD
ncbi:MAG: hypothetical protein HY290_22870, partial [Planctomycetia bacterium]|nr:hypothetical protein [Planctomycetia bacterium]